MVVDNKDFVLIYRTAQYLVRFAIYFFGDYMVDAQTLYVKLSQGYEINKAEAMILANEKKETLAEIATALQKKHNDNRFELCSIINAKSGICSEDCKFCAQSNEYKTDANIYGFIENEMIYEKARICSKKGINRFSIVTSGRSLSNHDFLKLCEIVQYIKQNIKIRICVSVGILNNRQYEILKNAGVTRIHNNIETSKRYFGSICTTHTYNDKINAIESAKKHGFEICSGGIIGMGETIEDRIDLAFEAKKIGVVSMPINVLFPIAGTPFEDIKPMDKGDVEKTVSLMKIINPQCIIRMAGGRKQLIDNGQGCFIAGSNATITGDMLTTSGVAVEDDINMLQALGYILQ